MEGSESARESPHRDANFTDYLAHQKHKTGQYVDRNNSTNPTRVSF